MDQGARLRARRAGAYIPQYRLAQAIDKSPSWLASVERGVTQPDAETWQRIYAALDRLEHPATRPEGVRYANANQQ